MSVPAVNCDGVVARLLLLLLDGSDDVDHALAVGWDAHLGPAVEVELPHSAGLVLLGRADRETRRPFCGAEHRVGVKVAQNTWLL